MKTKYLASEGWNSPRVETVQVESETSSTVTIKGKRRKKETQYESYFDTWQEAHEWLLRGAEGRLTSARRSLEMAQGFHGNVKGMKQPQPGEG